MDMTLVYQVEHYAPFGPLIVLYFFLAGMSAGLFLISSLSTVFGWEKVKPLAKSASVMALSTLIPGLLALVADLGQPMRFFTLIFRFNPASVMSWGTYIIILYGIACLGYTWLLWQDDPRSKTWGKVGVVGALGLGMYTGLLLAVVPGHPLWNSAILPALFVISGLVAALCLITLAQLFFAKATRLENTEAAESLHSLKVWLVILEILLLAFHILSVLTMGDAGRAVGKHLLSGDRAFSFLGIQVLIGMIIPLAILLMSKRSPAALGLSGTLSLIGVLALRYNFVVAGEELPLSGTLMRTLEAGSASWIWALTFLILAFVLVLILPGIFENRSGRKSDASVGHKA